MNSQSLVGKGSGGRKGLPIEGNHRREHSPSGGVEPCKAKLALPFSISKANLPSPGPIDPSQSLTEQP